ncbi:MAG: hypothetical protein PHT71_00990 [Victivallaceae bacterium]|nr:hypothetical protein [Victivallaceae bacterium]
MRIKVVARSFVEARLGTRREAELFRKYRIISINNVSFPAEPPPFSARFRSALNLLTLFFDDVETGFPHAMTGEDARKIAEFIVKPDQRPFLIHCTAGISRSGAVGEVLNRYFNRDDAEAFQQFFADNPDLNPNRHVRQTLEGVLPDDNLY